MKYTPDSEMVLCSWLNSSFSASGTVSRDIPDQADWGNKDTLISVTEVTTNHDTYSTLRSGVVQIDVWGKAPSGAGRAPINRTSVLAQEIHDTLNAKSGRLEIEGPTTAFRSVRVTSLQSLGFARIRNDETASIAHFRGSATVVYVPLET